MSNWVSVDSGAEKGLLGGSLNWSAAESLVQDLAHDLRQPLSEIESIAYYLELAGAGDPSRSREMLEKIQSLVADADVLLTRAVAGVKEAAHPEAA